MKAQSSTEPLEPLLRPDHAFVVQLRTGVRIGLDELRGRVEHLTSGRSATFASLEDLLTFMKGHSSETA
jgi:hypothetical protein